MKRLFIKNYKHLFVVAVMWTIAALGVVYFEQKALELSTGMSIALEPSAFLVFIFPAIAWAVALYFTWLNLQSKRENEVHDGSSL